MKILFNIFFFVCIGASLVQPTWSMEADETINSLTIQKKKKNEGEENPKSDTNIPQKLNIPFSGKFEDLPKDVLILVLSYILHSHPLYPELTERHINPRRALSGVNRKLHSLMNDKRVWQPLYNLIQKVYFKELSEDSSLITASYVSALFDTTYKVQNQSLYKGEEAFNEILETYCSALIDANSPLKENTYIRYKLARFAQKNTKFLSELELGLEQREFIEENTNNIMAFFQKKNMRGYLYKVLLNASTEQRQKFWPDMEKHVKNARLILENPQKFPDRYEKILKSFSSKFFYLLAKQDDDESQSIIKIPADRGYAKAQYLYGCGLEDSAVVAAEYADDAEEANKLYKEAFDWYEKAALQGHVKAQCKVGFCYRLGRGVEKNEAQSLEWVKKAALQGNNDALYELAQYYEDKDTEQYEEWQEKFVFNMYHRSLFDLAGSYENGFTFKKNLKKALKWYKKAALEGNAKAEEAKKRLEKLISSGEVGEKVKDRPPLPAFAKPYAYLGMEAGGYPP